MSAQGGPAGIRVPDAHGSVRACIRSGGKGTKRLAADYGDRLVCVRYRYDETLRRRLKTVEIIVAEAPWNPEPFRRVFVAVEAWESKLRAAIIRAGGRWSPDRGQWHLRRDRAVKLGLARRMRPVGAQAEGPVLRPGAMPPRPQAPQPTSTARISLETKKPLPAETSPLKVR
jgi:hypothetical protein